MSHTISVPSRFNGPQTGEHGGYCSGVIAGFVEGPAEVKLRSPVPLDTPLDVVRENRGAVRVLEGETLIAEASPTTQLELEVPAPVDPEQARAAKARYRGSTEDLFSRKRPLSFLGRMTARIEAPFAAGKEHVVIAWPIQADGRKHHAGAAVLSSGGAVLAVARALMIEPREELPG